MDISEKDFEKTIDCALLSGGPDDCPESFWTGREKPCPYSGYALGGYHRAKPEDYDRAHCLLPGALLGFIYATQPREWEKLKKQHGGEVKTRFLRRLASEIEKRGTLDVLRKGIKDSGCKFQLAYFKPVSGLNSYRVQKTRNGKIKLERGNIEIEPIGPKGGYVPSPEEIEQLSLIIQELNQRFGTDFTDEDRVFIKQLEEKLAGDSALKASVHVNPPENARLSFDHVVNDRLQDMIDSNFKFYKQVTDNQEFSKTFLDWLFERYLKTIKSNKLYDE